MWLPIAGFENIYEINDKREVRRAATHRLIPVKSNKVTLCKNGVPQAVKVSDLTPGKISDLNPVKILTASEPKKPSVDRLKSTEANFGPWAANNTTILIGDAGEHLACYELAKRGIRCTNNVIEGAPYDIIGDFGSGKLFTVQVKSCSAPVASGNAITPAYNFRFPYLDVLAVDLLAFVALDVKAVYFTFLKDLPRSDKRFTERGFYDLANQTTTETLLKLYKSM